MPKQVLFFVLLCIACNTKAQPSKDSTGINSFLKPVKWRCIGPFRGGRSNCATGVAGNPAVYYQATTVGGLFFSVSTQSFCVGQDSPYV